MFEEIRKDGYTEIPAGRDQRGREVILGMAEPRILEQDGAYFKDLTGDGILYPFEDWRLDDDTRAEDLASRLSIREIAGLMLYSSHQTIPARQAGPFIGHYNGGSMEEAGAQEWDLTDEQKRFLERDGIRHVLLAMLDAPEHAARWTNELQRYAEKSPFGIPVCISSDPRHGVSAAGAEFKNSGSGVSVWPEGIGMTSLNDTETVKRFAETAAVEYRAMGITTALWPQIDLATEPRWMRFQDTPGGDAETNIAMARAYCDGLQTTPGEEDGWGRESVIAMAKHWPGGGPVEGGRDAHYPFGRFAVYPGDNFAEHVRVFTEGAFQLDGPTKCAGAVMPYYTVSWGVDTKNHENVGNSYSEYLIHDLLRDRYHYDGVICTDWGITQDPDDRIDSFGSRCYGVEELTETERHLRIIMNGVDQFGGNNDVAPVMEAYRIGCEKYGESVMRVRFEESAARLLREMFRLGLFENPYVEPERAKKIVGCGEFRQAGCEAQAKSAVLLKNKGQVLPLEKGIKIWCPERKIAAKKNFFRGMDEERILRPLAEGDLPEGCVPVKDPSEADAAVVFVESPISDGYSSEDAAAGGNGYLPISLQYRPYQADAARAVSIAGGDFREKFTNRSYRGKTNRAANESDLDHVLEAREAMGEKPVIVCITMSNPCVVSEFEPYCDAILCDLGIQKRIVMDIIFGDRKAGGILPFRIPKNMETIERHKEDRFDDYEAYTDSEGNVYATGFGIGSSGKE